MIAITWSYPDSQKAIAHFTAGAAEVTVSLKQSDRSWQVNFTVEGQANEVAYAGLTIFSGVFEAVAQFLAVREPQTVLFTADREDLVEIYRTYLQKECKKFTGLGYRLDSEHRVLRRFKPSRWAATVEA